jgi:hypothetical protein
MVRAKALNFRYRVNVNTLVHEPVASLQMNDIAYVEFETVSPLFFDPYTQNRITGSFILIDPISNATLGAGMIRADLAEQSSIAELGAKAFVPVSAAERTKRHGHAPAVVLVEGSPSLAARLERALFDDHFEVLLVGGESTPLSTLELQLQALQSDGLVVIISSAPLNTADKTKLSTAAGDRFFDLSALQLPEDESEAARKMLAQLQSLRG